MKKIRKGVFETNSSSTHTITMCTKSDYNKFVNGEMYIFDDELITKEERNLIARKLILEEEINTDWDKNVIKFRAQEIPFNGDWADKDNKVKELILTEENINSISDEDIENHEFEYYDIPLTYEQYINSRQNETYKSEFTAKSGETIIAFGEYGYDG